MILIPEHVRTSFENLAISDSVSKTKTDAGSGSVKSNLLKTFTGKELRSFIFSDYKGRRYKKSYHFERVFVKLKGLSRELFVQRQLADVRPYFVIT
jgi:hypothetical protein